MIDITSLKFELLRDMFASNEIVQLIDSQASGYDPDSPDSLLYNNLYPYLKIFETQTKADSYVMCAIDKSNVNRINNSFHNLKLTIWCMAHQDRMRVKGRNGTRIDLLGNEVEKLLDGSQKYGHGVLELVADREIILNEKYLYRELIFESSVMKPSADKKVGRFN